MTSVEPTSPDPSLAQLGEWELIRRLAAFAPAGQLDDDAALLELPPSGGDLVVNTDVMVEGLHFSDSTTSPEDVGWRVAAANFSDLAAMGCLEVVGLTVALVAPPDTPWSWVEGVYTGLAQAMQRHGGVLLGGDCSGGRQRMLSITALGRLDGPSPPDPGGARSRGGPIRRGDGRPGDRLVSSGPHGLSRLGLAVLQNSLTVPAPADLAQRAMRAHRRPQPRFDVVRALIDSRPEDRPWRVGGCDSSDGLVAAARCLASASGCEIRLDRAALPLDPAMAALIPQARDWCLGGGEDFELLLALAPAWAEALCAALPDCRVVGQLQAGEGVRWNDGQSIAAETGGYEHFS